MNFSLGLGLLKVKVQLDLFAVNTGLKWGYWSRTIRIPQDGGDGALCTSQSAFFL